MNASLRIFVVSLMAALSLTAGAQGVVIVGTDGSRIDYPREKVSSIEFYETAPAETDVPADVSAVDLGLSVKWATCNVGAQQPSDAGAHFAWGETAEKQVYDWASYFDFDCTLTGQSISGTDRDVAQALWGGTWRLPTLAETQELCDLCTWEWTEQAGQPGCTVTGPSGQSIFIPAAGTRQGTGLYLTGNYGSLLTGELDSTNSFYARSLVFYNTAEHWIDTNLRDYGQSARAVMQ